MRNLIIMATILFANIAYAQNKDTVGLKLPFTNGKVVYQKTFKVPGKSRSLLFTNAREWFEKRYNNLDSVNVQDASNGRLTGSGWDVLSFKGPLHMDVTSRVGKTIEINSANDIYSINISDIIIGYQEEPELPRTYFTAEDLVNHVLGKKYPRGTLNPVPFNKKLSKKALVSLNKLVADLINSVNQNLLAK
ncbi:DUF4468 domain-containing protein [Mucilaginibacter sp. UR6-11]|uniref:DUF4468 domain-containing protein n=1 Tax=Mucilaginibacter sp. UR6-11 TaxID=1435644 RepID=UPI001E62A52D|nr:DUF4468 domain-containing protein [Mucilaginibacter sp. UR6-11]MCC8426068.1 DUF4468 domain-containing protein [Mucilaginibacter sp. UR6-11]